MYCYHGHALLHRRPLTSLQLQMLITWAWWINWVLVL